MTSTTVPEVALEFKHNNHVDKLNRYLPFNPDYHQIYEEGQSKNALAIESQTLRYVKQALDSGARCILLTGNAGHGKTHICRRVLMDPLGYDEPESRRILQGSCDGASPIPAKGERPNVKPVRIFKDFSDYPLETARAHLVQALAETEVVTIVCVNEGKLRAILSTSGTDQSDSYLNQLNELFSRTYQDGIASSDGTIHIANMNYQSIAGGDGDSLIEKALSVWVEDGRKWSVCSSCAAKEHCPILRNRELLADQTKVDPAMAGGGTIGFRRRQGIEQLFGIAERMGEVVTIRDMLIFLALVITGNKRCAEVHKDVLQGSPHAYRHAFHQVIFDPPIHKDQRDNLPLLDAMKRLDPGTFAKRSVDDRLAAGGLFELEQLDLRFPLKGGLVHDAASGMETALVSPTGKKERESAMEANRALMMLLRRRNFFEGVAFDESASTVQEGRARAVGLQHMGDFLWLLTGESDAKRRSTLKGCLIAGLHSIQGLQLPRSEDMLHLVDPAYARSGQSGAVIARSIQIDAIRLLSPVAAWERNGSKREFPVEASVDWIHRHVAIELEDETPIKLDVFRFEILMRAGKGSLIHGFYRSDIAALRNALALIASNHGQKPSRAIRVVVDGKIRRLSIDEGGVIRCGIGG